MPYCFSLGGWIDTNATVLGVPGRHKRDKAKAKRAREARKKNR